MSASIELRKKAGLLARKLIGDDFNDGAELHGFIAGFKAAFEVIISDSRSRPEFLNTFYMQLLDHALIEQDKPTGDIL